ncbi:MAG: hypothetical protein RMK29_06840 [Myxococcales bacterium]|nr:hypothetical protein [Myxococcota bacterium]MDW8281409.1 hypothetical protein [Myxococcales bacterium]
MTRLSIITNGALLIGITLLGASCQGELKLLNKDPAGMLDFAPPPDLMPPPDNEVSFLQVNGDMDQPALGCTSPVRACHGTDMPVGVLKLAPNGTRDMSVLMANYEEAKKQVNLAQPAESKLLTKPLATRADVPHMGGKSYFRNEMDPIYQRWLAWIRCGAKLEAVKIDTCPGGM